MPGALTYRQKTSGLLYLIISTNYSHLEGVFIIFLGVSEHFVFHNTKAKIYPDGTQKFIVCSKPIFKDSGWEASCRNSTFESKPKNMLNGVRSDSVKRAKEKVFDIALINPFTHFITWTLNGDRIDRYNPVDVSKKLKVFLNNNQKRHSAMYLIIPEYHKDGAIHLHGLISGDFQFIDSGKKTKCGKVIYNMPQWSLGYSTAIELTGDSLNVAKYITKYISKDFKKIFGSFYYSGGKGLQRLPQIKLYDMDYASVNAKEYNVNNLNFCFKYFECN